MGEKNFLVFHKGKRQLQRKITTVCAIDQTNLLDAPSGPSRKAINSTFSFDFFVF